MQMQSPGDLRTSSFIKSSNSDYKMNEQIAEDLGLLDKE